MDAVMKKGLLILAAALVGFPSFAVARYGECCTNPGGCRSGGETTRPCCKEQGPCCTPTIVTVDNLVPHATLAAPFAGDIDIDAGSVETSTVERLKVDAPECVDPSHVPRLFILNCSLLR